MQISQLYIYPIKSLRGLRVKNAKVEQRGLLYDRRWMLVDSNNRFISLRQDNSLIFLETDILGEELIVRDLRNGNSYSMALHPQLYKDKIEVSIWEDTVESYEISIEANEWFSNVLQKDVKLVYMPDEVKRPIAPEWSVSPEEHVSFADELPLLIIGQASLDDLNAKTEEYIDMLRFRPTIVVTGGEPYEEFLWKDIKIGDYHYRGLKPCVRCKVTTINPDNGVAGREPLLTLSRQTIDEKMAFGQHAIVADPAGAVIREGDLVEIIERKEAPFDSL